MKIWLLAFHNTFFDDDYIVGICETKEKAKELLDEHSIAADWCISDDGNEYGYQQGTNRLWRIVKYTVNELDNVILYPAQKG